MPDVDDNITMIAVMTEKDDRSMVAKFARPITADEDLLEDAPLSGCNVRIFDDLVKPLFDLDVLLARRSEGDLARSEENADRLLLDQEIEGVRHREKLPNRHGQSKRK